MKKNKNQPPSSRRPASSGKQNAAIFSYYNNRSSSPQNVGRGRINQPRGKGFNWQLVPSFIAVAAIIGSIIYASTLSTAPLVRKSKSSPTGLLQADAVYTETAQRLLTKSIFNRSKLLIDTKHIEGQLLEAFPELQGVSITVPLTARQPIVTIKAAEPRLILRTTSGAYVIDDTGKALLKITDESVAAKLKVPTVQDETGLRVEVGKAALAPRDVSFINELAHQLQAKNIQIESLTLPALANELHLKAAGQGYLVKFNLLGDPRLQFGTYQALKQRLDGNKTKPSEYIDVRVEEKAFYK